MESTREALGDWGRDDLGQPSVTHHGGTIVAFEPQLLNQQFLVAVYDRASLQLVAPKVVVKPGYVRRDDDPLALTHDMVYDAILAKGLDHDSIGKATDAVMALLDANLLPEHAADLLAGHREFERGYRFGRISLSNELVRIVNEVNKETGIQDNLDDD